MRKMITILCFVLAFAFTLITIKESSALNQNHLLRSIGAIVAPDTNATLKLEGFNNQTLTISNINKKYFNVGYITNNSKQIMTLKITVTPDFTKVTSKGYWMGINFGGTPTEFTSGSAASTVTVLSLSPGQIVDVQGALIANQGRDVIVSYTFQATASDNSFSMTLNDTTKYPRRMIFR